MARIIDADVFGEPREREATEEEKLQEQLRSVNEELHFERERGAAVVLSQRQQWQSEVRVMELKLLSMQDTALGSAKFAAQLMKKVEEYRRQLEATTEELRRLRAAYAEATRRLDEFREVVDQFATLVAGSKEGLDEAE